MKMSSGSTGPLPATIGRYLVRERIGAGGMATVYRAYDSHHQREVALKVLAAHLADVDPARARFARESNALQGLSHPHILPVYDVGEENGVPFMVMALLPGQSLADRMGGKPLPIAEVARITRQIASALDYAHEHGIIHRDIKPTNILIDADGKPFLADFGVAFLDDAGARLTEDGAFVGTVAYASPEQCRGETVDANTDIYSLAVVVFEMLTGRRPFEGASSLAVMKQHMNEPPPNPIAYNPALPVKLYTVLARALAKLPDHRYPSALRFSDELNTVLGIQGVRAFDDDEMWLYGAVQAGDAPIPGTPPTPAATQARGPFPYDGSRDLPDEPYAGVGKTDVPVMVTPPPAQPEPVAEPAPRSPVVRPLEPAASRSRPDVVRPLDSAPPRPARSWTRRRVVAGVGIALALVLVGLVASVAAGLLSGDESPDTITVYSGELRLVFEHPPAWSSATDRLALLSADPVVTVVLSDSAIGPDGATDDAALVIALQRIRPADIYAVPRPCASQVPFGPLNTFACMAHEQYAVPVYEPFTAGKSKGVRLPGTLPPTPATLPIILLPFNQTTWTAVIIVQAGQHPAAADQLEAVARSVRPAS